ncbi:MAG: serine/threonine protein kinase [Acidobacteria bacterium]|nr:serine/threonine protein kinase [Acidobacteriota bacterium]MBI3427795.1 serine/threonine protein kinase [Acidobacteriota bacterium]
MSPQPKSGNLRECVSCKQCFGPGQQLCPNCFIELVTVEATPHLLNERYRLDRIVTRGASNLLFAGFDVVDEQPVAIKLIRAGAMLDPRANDRFLREAELAAGFKHPGLAEIFAFGLLDEGGAYVAFELTPGTLLRSEMRRVGQFTVEQAVPLLCVIAGVLHDAHCAGLVHRDLKPENIILPPPDPTLEQPRVKLVDFSFGRVSGGQAYQPGKTARLQNIGQLPSRPAYLSPEQFLGAEADPRADIFSLGVIAYEMLAGQPPFKASRVGELAGKVLHERPASLRNFNPEISVVIEAEILRALEKEPHNRQQHAAEFKRELQNALHWN